MTAIVDVLETYLKHARSGQIKHIAISAAGDNNYSGYAFMGQQPYEALNQKAVDAMSVSLKAAVDNWAMPDPDPSLDASYVCYHCGSSPHGFDFLIWLITREMRRIKSGAPAPLKVAFWCGKNPAKFDWIENVYRPIMGLIGAVEDNKAWGRPDGPTLFTSGPLVELYNEGVSLPQLVPVNSYPDLPTGVVTITLREATHTPQRNSDIKAWTRFARHLQQNGERVVFVRDTAKACEPLAGFETCPMASMNIDARMALYANAKMNLFVSNGPATMTWFSDKPFLCFTPPEPESSDYEPNKPSFWKQNMGVEVGNQYPWFKPNQRIVWQRDTYDAIKKAYNAIPC